MDGAERRDQALTRYPAIPAGHVPNYDAGDSVSPDPVRYRTTVLLISRHYERREISTESEQFTRTFHQISLARTSPWLLTSPKTCYSSAHDN